MKTIHQKIKAYKYIDRKNGLYTTGNRQPTSFPLYYIRFYPIIQHTCHDKHDFGYGYFYADKRL